jgi:hypothetical protein
MSELTPPLPTPFQQHPVANPPLPQQDVASGPSSQARQPPRFLQVMTVPLLAGMVFAVCGLLAAGSVEYTLRKFAQEGGISSTLFLLVPGLSYMLFALIVYQDPKQKLKRIADSLSRGLLVGLLTWASFSALATWVWCLPEHYLSCYGNFLLVSGIIGGGPMLAAALTAGALVGWIIRQNNLASLFD